MGGPWPMKAAIYSRLSAVNLKVWLRETNPYDPMTLIYQYDMSDKRTGFCLYTGFVYFLQLWRPLQLSEWNSLW